MAKKDAQISREPTKRQLALSRKEREQQRLFFMGLGLVVALIVLVLAIGLIQTYVIEPNAPVASVNGEEITTGEYQDRVLYERFVLEDQYQQILNELQALPPAGEGEDQFSELIRNQYQQFAQQILQQRSLVDRQTLDNMITDRLVAAEAANRGLTVTEDEVTETINRRLAGRQGGVTTAAAEETRTARSNATATAALWTPTPTFTPSPTLTTTEAITPTATPIGTPTPAPTPTFNIVSEGDLSTAYTNWVNTISEATGLSEAQYRTYVRQELLRQKLGEVLGEEVPTVAEQANARHILIETEEEAQDVVARLEAGEAFADLAEELSQDPGSAANGGELGFAPRGRYVPSVDDAVFSLPIGEVSEPIQSDFGWHVIEVLAREEQELLPADYAQQQRQAFTDWLTSARQNATIEDFWTADQAPADPFFEQQ